MPSNLSTRVMWFLALNTFSLAVLYAWAVLSIFAMAGANAIIVLNNPPVLSTPIGILGMNFINLLYHLAFGIAGLFILVFWVCCNIWLFKGDFERLHLWLYKKYRQFRNLPLGSPSGAEPLDKNVQEK